MFHTHLVVKVLDYNSPTHEWEYLYDAPADLETELGFEQFFSSEGWTRDKMNDSAGQTFITQAWDRGSQSVRINFGLAKGTPAKSLTEALDLNDQA